MYLSIIHGINYKDKENDSEKANQMNCTIYWATGDFPRLIPEQILLSKKSVYIMKFKILTEKDKEKKKRPTTGGLKRRNR